MMSIETIFERPVLTVDHGRVTEVGDYGSEKAFVVVSEIPCSVEIQGNIVKVLEFLGANFAVKGLFQVYSAGEYEDHRWYESTSEKKILDQMLATGQITGAERYVAGLRRNHVLVGVDEEDRYVEALELRRRLSESSEGSDRTVAVLRDELETLKGKYFTQENQVFNEHVMARQSHESGWFYEGLREYSSLLPGAKGEYRNLYYQIESQKIRKTIDFNEANREIQALLNRLKEHLSYRNYGRLVSPASLRDTAGLLYVYVSRIVEMEPQLAADLGSLRTFLAYYGMSQDINPIALVAEEKAFIREVFRRNVRTFGEREVVCLLECLDALDDFFHFTTRANYEWFHANLHGTFRRLWAKYTGRDVVPRIKEYLEVAEAYYRNTIARGERFLENSKVVPVSGVGGRERTWAKGNCMEEAVTLLRGAKDVYVFVVGGFHAGFLAEEFGKAGQSYVVILPNVTTEPRSDECYRILAERVRTRLSA